MLERVRAQLLLRVECLLAPFDLALEHGHLKNELSSLLFPEISRRSNMCQSVCEVE